MIKDANRMMVFGAGTMGHGLALLAAKTGYPVYLTDVNAQTLENAVNLIAAQLDWLEAEGDISTETRKDTLERIEPIQEVASILPSCRFIIEAVTENQTLKKDLYSTIAPLVAEDAIIASNTSYLDVFKLAPKQMLPRFAVAHFYAPPYLIPLVEMVGHEKLDADVIPDLTEMLLNMGQEPILLKRFVPGFIINRLQRAMGREIFHLLEEDIADPEAIDIAVKASLALRIPVVGVVQRYDFTGLDASLTFLQNPSIELVNEDKIPKCLETRVKSGHLGVKSGKGFFDYGDRPLKEILLERDRRMLALRRFLKEKDILYPMS